MRKIPANIHAVRVLVREPADQLWVGAHVEAYDHLAITTVETDGSIEIAGPAILAREIDDVANELAAHLHGFVLAESR